MRPKTLCALAVLVTALAGAPAANAGDQNADVSALWSITPGGHREVVAFPGQLDAGAHGAWSPDSSQIAFIRYSDDAGKPTDFGRLVVKAADSSEAETTVARGVGAFDGGPLWSPDGTRIAYVDHNGDLRTVAPTGGKSKLVTRGAYIEHVRWSPDGSRLVYEDEFLTRCKDHSLGTDVIFVTTLDGTRTRLTKSGGCKPVASTDHEPVWVGNDAVAFVRNFDEDAFPVRSVIYTTRVAGPHRLRKIVVPSGDSWEVLGGDLVSSGDGQTLAIELAQFRFHNGDLVYGEPHELWLLAADGSSAKQLPLRPFEGTGPAFAPDGDLIVCGGRGVVRLDAQTGRRSLISRFDGCVTGDWAPDGKHFLALADLSN